MNLKCIVKRRELEWRCGENGWNDDSNWGEDDAKALMRYWEFDRIGKWKYKIFYFYQ